MSTGSEPATFTILLTANTLLTDTIATAAITAAYYPNLSVFKPRIREFHHSPILEKYFCKIITLA